MNSIIFSDTHLTKKFDHKQYNFLQKIIKSADQVIINGDLWDGMRISFDEFIESKWRKLFPLLKQKNTIYIYGNHDREERTDERVQLFSIKQVHCYTLKNKFNTFVVKHGDIFQYSYKKVKKTRLRHYLGIQFEIIEEISLKVFKRSLFAPYEKKCNKQIKQQIQGTLDECEILVCGHTHAAEEDIQQQFINTGTIRSGVGEYLLIEDDSFKLIRELY